MEGGAGGGGARVCLTRAVTHAAEGERERGRRSLQSVGRSGIISGHHAGKPPHLICKRNPLGKERGRGGRPVSDTRHRRIAILVQNHASR